MPKCRECGNGSAFLKLTKDGLCCACESERILAANEDFHISKVFSCYLPNNFFFFIGIDDKYKKFALFVQPASRDFHISYYNFADIIDFRMDKTETMDGKCNTIMISLFLNSLVNPAITFYVINSPTQIGSEQYNYAVHSANKIYGYLSYIRYNAQ